MLCMAALNTPLEVDKPLSAHVKTYILSSKVHKVILHKVQDVLSNKIQDVMFSKVQDVLSSKVQEVMFSTAGFVK